MGKRENGKKFDRERVLVLFWIYHHNYTPMFKAFSYVVSFQRNDREQSSPESQEVRKNDKWVDQAQDRQYMIGELSKLPSSKWFTFVVDPKNPNGFEVFYAGNSSLVARISWRSVLPLMEFPTIDVHSVLNDKRFIAALDSPKDVDQFLSKIADKQKDADFVLKNLSDIAQAEWFRFAKDPKNSNSIDVFIQWYNTRLASFSWIPSLSWALVNFPSLDVTALDRRKHLRILGSPEEIVAFLHTLKKEARLLGIVPWAA